MKKTAYLFSLLGLAVMMTSCNKDPEYFELPDQPDQMFVKASATDIVLEKTLANQTALTLSWNSAVSPISSDDKVTYGVRFYETAQKSDHVSDLIELGEGVNELSFTHDQLNNIVSRWALPGESVDVTAQVLAYIQNDQKYVKPISSKVSFKVVGYEKFPVRLYMHLVNTTAGTSKEVKLEQRQLGTGIYEAYVEGLTACDYYFTTTSAEYPAYGTAADGKLAYVESGSFDKFTNTETGKRTIIVDINDEYNDCRFLDMIQLPTPGQIWIVGDGTSIGWNPNEASGKLEMVGSAREPYLYAWTGEFIAGKEFKIGLGVNYDGEFFFAPESNADPLTNHTLLEPRLQSAGGDVKWVPSVSGRYTLTLSLLRTDMWTKFEPAE